MAGDPASGPLIGIVTDSGAALVKEGSLTAGWTDEWPDNAAYVVVASDPANGPLMGIVTEGTVVNPYENAAYVKEGGTMSTATWPRWPSAVTRSTDR